MTECVIVLLTKSVVDFDPLYRMNKQVQAIEDKKQKQVWKETGYPDFFIDEFEPSDRWEED